MDAPTATDDPARALVLATIGEHAGTMLRVARRYSLCADDAHDAYQRGLEIFLRRADSVEPDTAAAWLRTVVKHEALAIRASRRRVLTDEGLDPDREEARHLVPADERLEARERVERDFRTGIRAGVATTPTLFLPDGRKISGRPDAAVWAELE